MTHSNAHVHILGGDTEHTHTHTQTEVAVNLTTPTTKALIKSCDTDTLTNYRKNLSEIYCMF